MPVYRLDLGEKFDQLLSALATKQSMTHDRVIRRAVALLAFVLQETDNTGLQLSLTDQDNKIVKVINMQEK